jgi:hypothetical protein
MGFKNEQDRLDYEAKKRQQAREERNDIGKLPPVADPKRRAACENDFIQFCNTYLKDTYFYRPWSDTQIEIAKMFSHVVEKGGKQAVAHKRCGAKTTIARAATFWAAIYGKHKYIIYVGASEKEVKGAVEFFKNCILENDLLLADFPEVCVPFRKQNRRRNNNPTYNDRYVDCFIKESQDGHEIQFPIIEKVNARGRYLIDPETKNPIPYPTSGVLIQLNSIRSNIRGRNHTVRYCKNARPSLVLVDDIQNDQSARSETQIDNQLEVLFAAISQLSGYGTQWKRIDISVIYIGTCFQADDVTSILCNPEKTPSYKGVIFRRLKTMPVNMTAWMQYEKIWRSEENQKSDNALATEFYRKNRRILDEGAEADDPNDYTNKQISSIQYAMDCYCENRRVFWCEHQNNPNAILEDDLTVLTPAKVRRKALRLQKDRNNPSSRYIIPNNTTFLAGFIDVGLHYLNYEIIAFGDGYSMIHSVDFGVFPEQGVPVISKGKFAVDILDYYDDIEIENKNAISSNEYQKFQEGEKLILGITDCLKMIFTQQYYDGNCEPLPAFKIDEEINFIQHAAQKPFRFLTIGIDATDVMRREIIWNAVAAFNRKENGKWKDRVIPMQAYPSRTQPMRYYSLEPGEWTRGKAMVSPDQKGRRRVGIGEGDWIENADQMQRYLSDTPGIVSACLLWEANTYRTMRQNRLLMDKKHDGTHTIFDDVPENLIMFSEQNCSENGVNTRYKDGQRYTQWKHDTKKGDNEFFDTGAGCFALASYIGLNEAGATINRKSVAAPSISREEYKRIIEGRLRKNNI